MNARTRVAVPVAVCVLALGAAIGYLVTRGSQHNAGRQASPVADTSLATIEKQPRIVFRNTALGRSYGMVAMVSLTNPRGPRVVTATSCDRVYATTRNVLCLSSDRGIKTTYAAHVLDNDLKPTETLPLTGMPSRARLSRDGNLAATTSFTAGNSYAGASFSTQTVITHVGGATLGSLEDFTLVHDGRIIEPEGRNYWGVTFAADDDTFFATVEWSDHTWLVRGSISQRRMVTLQEDAECPSLSPDGTRIVFKQHGDLPIGRWRLVEYAIASGKITPVAETRSVDDQVEWLDNTTVMYGLSRTGPQAAVDDVWSVPADGGQPKILIPEAWSPAVVR